MKRQLTAIVAVLSLATAAFAQTATHTAAHKNVVQKHPTATGVVAGVATHSALKRSAAWKKKHHQKLNFAEKHPTMSGIAAGVATKKVIQHSTRHKK